MLRAYEDFLLYKKAIRLTHVRSVSFFIIEGYCDTVS
jgi:hypothetical protein